MSLSLSQLVSGVTAMPEPCKKKISCVLGSVVADAASLPLEWIYQAARMEDLVGNKDPEFWPESHCPFYSLPLGSVSCYSDELLTTLASLASSQGSTEVPDVAAAIKQKFGAPDSPYQIALAKRAAKVFPIAGPWINGGVINSLSNMDSGVQPSGSETCEDNDGLAVSLACFLSTMDQQKTKDVANILTTNSVAEAHLRVQALILENYLNEVENPVNAAKNSIAAELPEIAAEIDAVEKKVAEGNSLNDMVASFGKACSLPGSFQGALAAILSKDNYVSAVRSNITAGGDCVARGVFIGACLGIKHGVEGIPMEWIEKVTNVENVIQNCVKVFAASN